MRRTWGLLAAVLAAVLLAGWNPQVAGQVQRSITNDTLTVALGTEPSTLDPQRTSGDGLMVTKHIFNTLVFPDRNLVIRPELATRWAVASDGVTWTFELRRDVQFHDGTPFNAEAVVFNLRRALGPGTGPSLTKTWLDMVDIDGVKVLGEYTVQIRTVAPFGGFLFNLGHIGGGLMMSPASVQRFGREIGVRPVGTGPYRFVEWVRGQRIVLERNDTYWGPKPSYARVTFLPIPEEAARNAMLETGEAGVSVRVSPLEAARFANSQQIQVIKALVARPFAMWFNVTRRPLRDIRVRKALNHAVDKRELIKAFFLGDAAILDSVLPPGLPGYRSVGVYEYDPAKAKSLLAAAGYAQGLRLRAYCPHGRFTLDAEVCQAVAGQLAKVGVTVEVRTFGDYAAFLSTLEKEPEFDMYFFGWASGSLDPDGALWPTFASENAGLRWNFGRYRNARVDRLIRAARIEMDQSKRRQLYAELQAILVDDAPWIFLYTTYGYTGARKQVKDVWVRPDEQILFYNAYPAR